VSASIRQARLADEAGIADLYRRCWSPESEVVEKPPDDLPFPFFGPGRDPSSYLVAELEGRVVGWTRVAQPLPVASNSHVRQIQGLCVDPGQRGKGLGQALLEAAAGLARELGATRLTLRVLATNTAARRLYARAGFVTEGVLHQEFFIAGRYVDDLLMARSLV
jgi:RimJ/RimL family protein N-acetyltransferase